MDDICFTLLFRVLACTINHWCRGILLAGSSIGEQQELRRTAWHLQAGALQLAFRICKKYMRGFSHCPSCTVRDLNQCHIALPCDKIDVFLEVVSSQS